MIFDEKSEIWGVDGDIKNISEREKHARQSRGMFLSSPNKFGADAPWQKINSSKYI